MSNQLEITKSANIAAIEAGEEFVTMRVGGQSFGISVLMVQDVLKGLKVTGVPLAPREISGLMNLRGRIVTAINVRECFSMPKSEVSDPKKIMSVVVERKGELFSLIVDAIGEVVSIPVAHIEKSPANLSGKWRDAASGVYKMQDELLVILDVDKLLSFN
ncbi:MAG: chemotaxis protein CheW [Pseudomonadota bacterium]